MWYEMKRDVKKMGSIMTPILIAQLSIVIINFVNTTMSGHAGTSDLAGVAIGAGIFGPLMAAIVGFLMAGSPIIAQYVGKHNVHSVPAVVRTGLYFAIIIGALCFIGYFFAIDSLLSGLSLEPEVDHIARYYLLFMIGALLVISLVIPLRLVIDIAGSASTSMKLFMLAVPCNILMNYIFMFGHFGMPRLGGIGAGIATLLTYLFVLSLFITVIMKNEEFMGKEIFSNFKQGFVDWKEYLSIGVPNGLSILMEEGLFGVILILMTKFGTETLAAYQVASNFANLLYIIPLSCSMALTIMVAMAVGARNYELARRYRRAGLAITLTCSLLTMAATVLFGRVIASAYTSEAVVIELARGFLIYAAGWQFFDAVAAPIQGVLRGYKDTKVPFLLTVLAYWAICFPIGFYLDHILNFEAHSYWLGLDFGVGCSAIFMVWRLRKIEGKYIDDLEDEEAPKFKSSFDKAHNKRSYKPQKSIRKLTAELSKVVEKVRCDGIMNAFFLNNFRILMWIWKNKFHDLKLKVVGRASRAYVP